MKRLIGSGILFFYMFTTFPQSGNSFSCGSILTDARDGKTYPTIMIGTQCWMGRNLDIGKPLEPKASPANKSIIEKYCYNDQLANCDLYGGLYTWDVIMQYSVKENARGICPEGWHVPSESDWTLLNNALGKDVAGGSMKEQGTKHWLAPNTGATNTSGFMALPAGFRLYSNATYKQLGSETNFWSSTPNSTTTVVIFNIDGSDVTLVKGYDDKRYAYSVRCIKN